MPSHQQAKPTRIRRMRTRGWRAGTARIVDRSSRYGNPWRIEGSVLICPDGTTQQLDFPTAARKEASARYRAWLDGDGPDTYTVGCKTFDRRRVLAGLPRLQSRDLACTCSLPTKGEPDYCHATVLLELAALPERTST
ncbi:DUF4326 domain-containing protein [Streptomyces sp. NBC_01549]|uniref:DUF4326 domain-containing protein n=1 Tax=Streptomyces sp. NBC_01549 TaxID=2975874 RepID=UPI00224D6404|nr:DUF4326 domain-containing protein [Streptomyces sp. NBC_01549]MCX4598298.1 DUF4326 domain-containing protein [Streptomyces sp. NBC_01549]